MQTSIITLTIAYIGWALYWKTIGLALLCYFLFIAVKYYRADISRRVPLMHKKETGNDDGPPFEADEEINNEVDDEPSPSAQFPAAYALSGEIKSVIADAARRQLIQQELLQAVRQVLLKPQYFVLQQTTFKPAINNLIAKEAAEHCSMHLEDRDLHMLWE